MGFGKSAKLFIATFTYGFTCHLLYVANIGNGSANAKSKRENLRGEELSKKSKKIQ
jgi:hypothetical protein